MHFLELILWAVLVGWCGIGLFSLWNIWGITVLRPGLPLEPLVRFPQVSILLAARNEQEALPAALESLLKLDYPYYNIILVDDDSSDRTGAIADEFARRPGAEAKLRVIHNHRLPAGWRGKVHAMSLAEQAATGEWILSTDADVVFDPTLLCRAMALALRKNVHLLSLTPQLEMQSRAEKIVMPAFGLLLFLLFPLRLVNRPGSACALAAGAFLLMRREALEALGGYARLRDTLIEDLRLAELFKNHGHRIYLAPTRGLFRTRMYKNWREVFEGLARSAYEGAGFSLWKILGGIVAGNALAVLPWTFVVMLALLHAHHAHSLVHNTVFLTAAAAVAVSAAIYYPIIAFAGLSPLYAFALPLATLFYSAVSLVSAFSSNRGPGVRWKGRYYQPPAP